MDRDRQAYEERYGERVIYCTRHKMSGIDGCIACDNEERDSEDMEMVTKCVTCHYESSEDEFITVEIKETDTSSPICQGCYDGYMKQVGMVKEENFLKATALADSVNTDYLD